MKVTAKPENVEQAGWFRPLLLALGTAPLLLVSAGCGQEDGFAAEPETGAAAAPDTRPIVNAAVIAPGFLADVLESRAGWSRGRKCWCPRSSGVR